MSWLRDYQDKAVESAFREWEENAATLIVVPTGGGKTCIFAEVIRRMQPKRALVIAHREELIFQAKDKIERFAKLDCEIEMADMVASTSLYHRMPVVIATVQTLISGNGKKRMERFNPKDFGLVVVDEAHHITAASYRRIIDYFRSNTELKVLAVTATPDRADEEALGQLIDTVAFNYSSLEAIHDGWLVSLDQQMVHVHGLDFSQVRTTAGDLNGADLAAVMEAEKNVQGVVGASIEIVGNKRTIMFASSVVHAEMACAIFNRHRPGMAGFVCGKTDKETRRKELDKFSSGKTQVLCNVGIATEGYDVPAAEVCIMARPTKSRALYNQMAGRVMRPLPGVVDGLLDSDERKLAIWESTKQSALIIDFAGNSGRHKLMTTADILGGIYSDDVIELAKKKAEKRGQVNMVEVLKEADDELKREAEARRRAEEARKARLVAKVQFSSKTVNPFDAYDITPVREHGWDKGKTISEKQANIIRKYMELDPYAMPAVNAKQLVDEWFRRNNNGICTMKQARRLKPFGFDTREMPKAQATKLITELAANGWQRPASWGAVVSTETAKSKFTQMREAVSV